MNFDQAFEDVVGIEGNYSDHPSDSGGKTMYGITEKVAKEAGWHGAMKDLPLATAKHIYRASYWDLAGCDTVERYYPDVAGKLFEIAVNVGTRQAVKWLQIALNAFNNRQTHYLDIEVDGFFGSASFDALRAFQAKRKQAGGRVLLAALTAQQGAFYLDLVARREKDEAFIYGWFQQRIVST